MEIPSTYFPPEIFANILVFLPTKSVLRFRCVCESWRALIDGRNPDFDRKNINYQTSIIEKNDNGKYAVILPGFFDDEFRCYDSAIPEAVILTSSLNRNRKTTYPITNVSSFFVDDPKRVLGCCHGLVCIVVATGGRRRDIMLWNPVINCYKTLPHRPTPCDYSYRHLEFEIGGIGYDASSDDYKIFSACNKIPFVFSVKLNSWKKIEGPFPYDSMYTTSVFVNRCIHMVVFSVGDFPKKSLVSFDLGTEKFKEYALPSSVPDPNDKEFSVFVVKGMLGLAISVHSVQKSWFGHRESQVYLWVMKDSWIKFATLSSQKRMYQLCKRKRISPTTSFDNTGEVLLKEKSCRWVDNIVRYDHHGNDEIDTGLRDVDVFVTSDLVVPYVESLLSPLHLSQ